MKIAFIIQNLTHKTDSIGYDCIFQYWTLQQHCDEIRVFAVLFDHTLHPGVDIAPFEDFYPYIRENPETIVIYHFCDGWAGVDDFLTTSVRYPIVRWHNNTPPWFYAVNEIEFAEDCVRGYQIITRLAKSPNVRFWVNSEFTRRQLEALADTSPATKTVFPASPFLSKKTIHGSSIPYETRTTDAPVEILFVSRVVPHKGHKHVLSVAAEVKHQLHRPVHVKFVGSCEDRQRTYWTDLQSKAEALQLQLTLTGVVSDEELVGIYQGSDVFVCLSEHEGFGMPVFEAMRCRVPVVAWGASAFADLLIGHPLVCQTFDIQKFAAAVIAALQPENRELVGQLQTRLLGTYTKGIIEQQLLDALRPDHSAHAPNLQLLMDPAGVAAVNASVEFYYARIKTNGSHTGQSFQHDAPVNYVSQYDLNAYRELLSLVRERKSMQENADKEASFLAGRDAELKRLRRFVSDPIENTVSEIKSVEELLELNDELFVDAAYMIVLGRTADSGGKRTYLRKLRAGAGRGSVILWLSKSDEGRRHNADLPGLAQYLRAQESSHRTLSRRYFPAKWLNDDLIQAQREYNRLTRNVGLLQRSKRRAELRVHHVDDLCELDGREFVEMAYKCVLGRPSDQEGREYYERELANGLPKAEIIRAFAESEEGRRFDSDIEGLQDYLSGQTRDKHWLWGALTENSRAQAQLRRLINGLGSLNQNLAAYPVKVQSEDSADGSGYAKRLPVEVLLESPFSQSLLRQNSADCVPLPTPVLAMESEQSTTEYVGEPTVVQHIHQILITDAGTIPDQLPLVVSENIESIKRHHPKAAYHLWDRTELRRFIAEKFTDEVLRAYDTLSAYALKADLGRYCLLYYYGGLYSDLSNRFLNPIVVRNNREIACFREHKPLHGAHWMVQNTIIYAAPGLEEIKLAIELVIANVRDKHYGVNSLAPSGPVLFGRVFAVLNRPQSYEVGQAVNLQVEGGLNRACYISEDGTFVAVRLQGGGGKPMELGLGGTNVYGQLWDHRNIYSEGTLCFPFDYPGFSGSATLSASGLAFTEEMLGELISSPPTSLPRAKHTAAVRFHAAHFTGALNFSIRGFGGRKIFAELRNMMPDASGRVSMEFELLTSCDDVRLTISSSGSASGAFQDVTFTTTGRIRRPKSVVARALAVVRRQPDPTRIASASAGTHDYIAPALASNIEYILQSDLNDGNPLSPHLAQVMQLNFDSLVRLHRRASVHRMTLDEARDFISMRFTQEVVSAFDSLRSPTAKEDLARYCWLFATGGLIADRTIRFVNPLCIPEGRTIAYFRDARPVNGVLWAVSPAIIYSAPSQNEIQLVIEHFVANARMRTHEYNTPGPTGAELLGRVLAASYRADSYLAGEEIPITPGLPKDNRCFLSPDGKLIAVRVNEARPEAANFAAETTDAEELLLTRAASG